MDMDIHMVGGGIALMADQVQHDLHRLDNHLGSLTSAVDVTREHVGACSDGIAAMRKDLGGLPTIDQVHKLQIQIERIRLSASKALGLGFFLD